MVERDPKYEQVIEDINNFVCRRITREWKDSFGSMVLVSAPTGMALDTGDVSGWASDEVRAEHSGTALLMGALYSLCMVIMGKEGVSPEAIHKLVLAAALKQGVAEVIVVNVDPSTFDDDDDIPQA